MDGGRDGTLGEIRQMDRQMNSNKLYLIYFKEQNVSKQLMKCLQNYTTANDNINYNEVSNDVLDFVQDRVSYISINN